MYKISLAYLRKNLIQMVVWICFLYFVSKIKMQHKKIIAALMFLGLLTLTACGWKKIDDNDLVSIDYKYTFSDWTVIEEWTKDITIGASNSTARIDSIIMWAKKDREFNWKMNWK